MFKASRKKINLCDSGSILTPEVLEYAIYGRLLEIGIEVDEHDAEITAKELAKNTLQFFNFNSRRILDIPLSNHIPWGSQNSFRGLFQDLEDMGLVRAYKEEYELYDGREWRSHFWEFRLDVIQDLWNNGYTKPKRKEINPVKELYEELWSQEPRPKDLDRVYKLEREANSIKHSLERLRDFLYSDNVNVFIDAPKTLTQRIDFIKKLVSKKDLFTELEKLNNLKNTHSNLMREYADLIAKDKEYYELFSQGSNIIQVKILKEEPYEKVEYVPRDFPKVEHSICVLEDYLLAKDILSNASRLKINRKIAEVQYIFKKLPELSSELTDLLSTVSPEERTNIETLNYVEELIRGNGENLCSLADEIQLRLVDIEESIVYKNLSVIKKYVDLEDTASSCKWLEKNIVVAKEKISELGETISSYEETFNQMSVIIENWLNSQETDLKESNSQAHSSSLSSATP